ncbi:hypothetical protein OCK74_08610 [Chitinophagaceae bacterium LB-8]|uniref:Uncharacterized protein n=1 Tax=Paraflavisolibacter caeni TaxID=2982496 RepID=A0A9X3BFL8_9BACT|nr:hypothetical protein [Paraflavisolibacter caeni]MCU7549174.1 hypothetical protein [Paraflavisolibacter caeni]
MAFASSTVQPTNNVSKPAIGLTDNVAVASVLSAVLLSLYAGQKSRKQLRKLKRKMTWLLIKQKLSSLFSNVSDRQLIIYILIGIITLVLLFTYPLAALVLAIIALILLLTGTI